MFSRLFVSIFVCFTLCTRCFKKLVLNFCNDFISYKVDVLHVRLIELHAAHQNLPPAIRTLRLKETIQNIHQKRTKSDNMFLT